MFFLLQMESPLSILVRLLTFSSTQKYRHLFSPNIALLFFAGRYHQKNTSSTEIKIKTKKELKKKNEKRTNRRHPFINLNNLCSQPFSI